MSRFKKFDYESLDYLCSVLEENFKEFLKDKLWGDSFWSPSYFLATTGNVTIDILKNYVENQRTLQK
jgi:REP element-mobilizing transposase RayT